MRMSQGIADPSRTQPALGPRSRLAFTLNHISLVPLVRGCALALSRLPQEWEVLWNSGGKGRDLELNQSRFHSASL